jgi:hypothetical protein
MAASAKYIQDGVKNGAGYWLGLIVREMRKLGWTSSQIRDVVESHLTPTQPVPLNVGPVQISFRDSLSKSLRPDSPAKKVTWASVLITLIVSILTALQQAGVFKTHEPASPPAQAAPSATEP